VTNETGRKSRTRSQVLSAGLILTSTAPVAGQSLSPLGYSVPAPRPISPAKGTTTPTQATQRQNPYLGSVPSKNTGTKLGPSLRSATERCLRENLGLIEANQASADVRSERLRSLSALLPQLSAKALRSRADLRSAEASVQAAAFTVCSQRLQRLLVISMTADYRGGGANIGNFNQVYTIAGNISVPIYTGGRIHADIEQAQADLARQEAEYEFSYHAMIALACATGCAETKLAYLLGAK
jgi:hypothetical protein